MADPTLRDNFIALFEHRMAELSRQYAAGEIDLATWQVDMRTEIRDAYASQIWAATNGDPGLDDYLKMGNAVQQQDRYLEDFAHQIEAGDVSSDAIASRAQLYARSGKVMYWKQAVGDMPTYPGEQQCLGNCGCEWIPNGDGSFTWQRSKDDSCPDCIHNEKVYSRYRPTQAA
jgi:hypothetical protein